MSLPCRPLTVDELRVLTWLITDGVCHDPEQDEAAGPADRDRWLAQLEATRAGRACGCGLCPSIELTDTSGRTPGTTTSRVVLEAATDDAVLLLFVDDDRLSYLELAPTDDRGVRVFPDPADLRTP